MARLVDKDDKPLSLGDNVIIEGIIDHVDEQLGQVRVRLHRQGTGQIHPHPRQHVRLHLGVSDVRKEP